MKLLNLILALALAQRPVLDTMFERRRYDWNYDGNVHPSDFDCMDQEGKKFLLDARAKVQNLLPKCKRSGFYDVPPPMSHWENDDEDSRVLCAWQRESVRDIEGCFSEFCGRIENCDKGCRKACTCNPRYNDDDDDDN